jgi:hypothetical protein
LRRNGHHGYVGESNGSCAFPPCSRPVVATLRLVVEGHESAVLTCARHADWMRGYVDEDAAVRLVGEIDEGPEGRFAEDDESDVG